MQKAANSLPYEHTQFVSSKQSILLIDDSFETLTINRIILELGGYEVFTAQSGSEALKIFTKIDEPNLILLDMQLGDMTGDEFLIFLADRNPEIIENVPVVFLTGMNKVPICKAIGHIRKPANIDYFLKSIHHFIEMGSCTPRIN